MDPRIVASKRLSPFTYEVVVDDGHALWYFHAFTKRGAHRQARTRLTRLSDD